MTQSLLLILGEEDMEDIKMLCQALRENMQSHIAELLEQICRGSNLNKMDLLKTCNFLSVDRKRKMTKNLDTLIDTMIDPHTVCEYLFSNQEFHKRLHDRIQVIYLIQMYMDIISFILCVYMYVLCQAIMCVSYFSGKSY